MSAHVAFVTEASAAVGLGHVSRCRAIGRAALAQGARVTFMVPPDPRVAALLGADPAALVAHDWPADPEAALDRLRTLAADAVVIDSYKADARFLGALRSAAGLVVAVDDTAERELPVDIVVNGSVAAEALPYRRDTETVLLLGPRYAPLDPGYADGPAPRLQPRIGRALVTLGGGLHRDALAAAVRAVDAVLEGGTIDVAAGPYDAASGGLDAPGARNRIAVHRDRFGLRDLMLAADVAVTGAGVTLYELAATATPAVVVCMADNQRPNADAFSRAGAAVLAGDVGDPGLARAIQAALARLAGDARCRMEVAARARALVDGKGAARVAARLLQPASARR